MGSVVDRPSDRLRRVLLSAALAGIVAVGVLVAGGAPGPQRVLGFDQTWTLNSCTGVSEVSSQWRFMDDAPGSGGVGAADDDGESAYISVNANDDTAESCTFWAALDVVANQLVVTTAVNDGATLTVSVHASQTCSGGLGSAVFSGEFANNAWATAFPDQWAATTVRRVCIRLADAQPANAQRLSALVDRIWLFNGTSLVWAENFGRPG